MASARVNTMSASPPPTEFAFPHHLQRFSMPWSIYLAQNPTLSGIIVSGVVVHPFPDPHGNGPTTNKVLIVQRAATDGFPLLWETPGGGVDEDDRSILSALQRELMEEAGLSLGSVVDLLEEGTEWKVRGGGRWRKVTFLVTVREQAGNTDGDGPVGRGPKVVLNAEEHADHAWASWDEVERGECQGRNIKFAYGEGKEIALRGLRLAGAWEMGSK
ncbi:NUDIX hydrolase domain-like protein [Podospora conica]|nr:NUDIX hydrolase domain-like protein [Schizothecium conicum]